jgi:hypothetical protein
VTLPARLQAQVPLGAPRTDIGTNESKHETMFCFRLSSTSTELAAGIIDWPSYYHLSHLPSNLLRPVSELLAGDVLEVGAGCGALTRFLGEAARTVVALDGSPAVRRSPQRAARDSRM